MTGFSAEDFASSTVEVVPGLWIGGGSAAIPDGVTAIVTLDEGAPEVVTSGVQETRAHFRDSRFEPVPHDVVELAVDGVADGVATLVRCAHGLNRAALVAALVLVARGVTADEAIGQVRGLRPGALNNPYFVELVRCWPNDPMPSAARPRPSGGNA